MDETLYWVIHSDKDHDLTDVEPEYVAVVIENIKQYENLMKFHKHQDTIWRILFAKSTCY